MADRLLRGPRRAPTPMTMTLPAAPPPDPVEPLQALGPLSATTTEPIYFKRGDTWPAYAFNLERDGEAWDTTDAISGVLFMQKQNSADPVIERTISFSTPRSGGEVVVQYEAGDTDISGTYNCEFELTYADGTMTFPSRGYFTIVIDPDLADAEA